MMIVRRFEDADAENLSTLMIEMARFYGASVAEGYDIRKSIIDNPAWSISLLQNMKETFLGLRRRVQCIRLLACCPLFMCSKYTSVKLPDAWA